MSTNTTSTLTVTRVVQADPDTVFRAWTEPERMKHWACPEDATVEAVDVDLTVGGRYRIRMQGQDEDGNPRHHTAVGVYREISRPDRLVYTWDWEEQSVGETVVTVEFKPMDGGTEIVLTHELFPNDEARDMHAQGWASCLNQLEGYVA